MTQQRILNAIFAGGLLLVAAFSLQTYVEAQSHEPSSSVSPAAEAAAVTPNDSTVLSPPCRSLYVGGTGDVSVDMMRTGSAIVFGAVPAGTILPARVIRVRSTGTTATAILCLY